MALFLVGVQKKVLTTSWLFSPNNTADAPPVTMQLTVAFQWHGVQKEISNPLGLLKSLRRNRKLFLLALTTNWFQSTTNLSPQRSISVHKSVCFNQRWLHTRTLKWEGLHINPRNSSTTNHPRYKVASVFKGSNRACTSILAGTEMNQLVMRFTLEPFNLTLSLLYFAFCKHKLVKQYIFKAYL